MKKYIMLLFMALTSLTFTSCLEGGLDDLPVFEDCEVANVRYAAFRWETTIPSGQSIVRKKALGIENQSKNETNIQLDVKVPVADGVFTTEVRNKINLKNIELGIQVSTAARVTPLNGAPKLGAPGDWSKPNTYRVTAADGKTYKDWTITVKNLIFE